jgi:DNA-binding NarL/FixJ family response regulator
LTARASSGVTVLLVEEHALVLAGLRALISATEGLEVIAEARTLADAGELARRYRPDVVLMDGRVRAFAARVDLDKIRRAAPEACLLVLADDALARAGPPRGANGCVAPNADVEQFYATVASLLGSSRCAACHLRPSCPVPALASSLSRRERQVAVLVAEGMQSKQIACALGIGVRTVNTYRESLARKLGASSAAVITRFVLKTGLTGGAGETAMSHASFQRP